MWGLSNLFPTPSAISLPTGEQWSRCDARDLAFTWTAPLLDRTEDLFHGLVTPPPEFYSVITGDRAKKASLLETMLICQRKWILCGIHTSRSDVSIAIASTAAKLPFQFSGPTTQHYLLTSPFSVPMQIGLTGTITQDGALSPECQITLFGTIYSGRH